MTMCRWPGCASHCELAHGLSALGPEHLSCHQLPPAAASCRLERRTRQGIGVQLAALPHPPALLKDTQPAACRVEGGSPKASEAGHGADEGGKCEQVGGAMTSWPACTPAGLPASLPC